MKGTVREKVGKGKWRHFRGFFEYSIVLIFKISTHIRQPGPQPSAC